MVVFCWEFWRTRLCLNLNFLQEARSLCQQGFPIILQCPWKLLWFQTTFSFHFPRWRFFLGKHIVLYSKCLCHPFNEISLKQRVHWKRLTNTSFEMKVESEEIKRISVVKVLCLNEKLYVSIRTSKSTLLFSGNVISQISSEISINFTQVESLANCELSKFIK